MTNENGWELYQFPPAFVLGFHGCDTAVGEAILSGKLPHLQPSENDYDWLGSGIYFWESNPQRALDFATQRFQGARHSRGTITDPFVLGAVIDLGYCLDLRDSSASAEVRKTYAELLDLPMEIPTNGVNLKVRKLDCAVFNYLHRKRDGWNLKAYDSVRATYSEGDVLYPGTDLKDQDHTQICIRNPDCVLGYFRPIQRNRA